MTKLLSTEQMAEFANSGCLFFEGLIDEDINKEFFELSLAHYERYIIGESVT